jgi:hypothetical protein
MPCALITALIFALVAIAHGYRIYEGLTVQIGPHSISMTVSWVALVVSALLGIWGFSDLGLYALKRFGALRS